MSVHPSIRPSTHLSSQLSTLRHALTCLPSTLALARTTVHSEDPGDSTGACRTCHAEDGRRLSVPVPLNTREGFKVPRLRRLLRELSGSYRGPQRFHGWVYIRENWEQASHQDLVHKCSQQQCSQSPHGGSTHVSVNRRVGGERGVHPRARTCTRASTGSRPMVGNFSLKSRDVPSLATIRMSLKSSVLGAQSPTHRIPHGNRKRPEQAGPQSLRAA